MLLPFDSSMNLSNAMAIADYDNTDQYIEICRGYDKQKLL